MGKPAARLSDTANTCNDPVDAPMGKVIAASTVLINNMPAAKQGDQVIGVDTHIIMVSTPGGPVPTPIPHPFAGLLDGGLSSTVLVEGKPAAVQGSTATNNPPHVPLGPGPFQKPPSNRATIMIGSPNVLIGDGGGGGGLGEEGKKGPPAESGHYLDVKLVDKGGKPITGVAYTIKSPDNKKIHGTASDRIVKTGIVEGDHEISIMAITKTNWSRDRAHVGEGVKMQVETAGIDDGAEVIFEVWEKDLNQPDRIVDTIDDVKIKGGKAEAEWKYTYREGGGGIHGPKSKGFSLPTYYFIVKVGSMVSRSGHLDYKDAIEIELRDEENNPVPDEEYILFISTGEIRSGKLDSNGRAKEEKIPPGECRLKFPHLEERTEPD